MTWLSSLRMFISLHAGRLRKANLAAVQVCCVLRALQLHSRAATCVPSCGMPPISTPISRHRCAALYPPVLLRTLLRQSHIGRPAAAPHALCTRSPAHGLEYPQAHGAPAADAAACTLCKGLPCCARAGPCVKQGVAICCCPLLVPVGAACACDAAKRHNKAHNCAWHQDSWHKDCK
jgi:hypothetical protein